MKRRLMITIGLTISSLVLACGWALAVPNTLQYQGRLTDAAGNPLNGLQTVTFAIYADSTVAGNLWTETRSVTVVNGLFNIVLGTGTTIPAGALDGSPNRFLGIRVAPDAEMTPRQRIASIPYAVRSGAVDNVPGITQGKYYGAFLNRVDFGTATAGTHVDIVTTTITTPASGYIDVEGGGQIGLLSPATIISYQIDETAGGNDDGNYYNYAGSNAGIDGYLPVTGHRLYFKPAGTYTFRLEARNQGGAGSPYFWNPWIIARYFGTNYGGVTTEPPTSAAARPSDGRQK